MMTRRQAHDVHHPPPPQEARASGQYRDVFAAAWAMRGGPAWCLPAALCRRGADGDSRRGVIMARPGTAGNRKLTQAAADPDLLPSA
jgi:hypothetical protein